MEIHHEEGCIVWKTYGNCWSQDLVHCHSHNLCTDDSWIASAQGPFVVSASC